MGNSNQGQSNIDTYEHPRLGTIKKIQDHNKTQLLLYQMILQNKKIYDEWIKQLHYIRQEEDVSEILFLPVYEEFKQTAYCGTGGILKLNFQDYFYSILPEIQNRRSIKRPFNEQELLYLFYSLIKISALLQAKNRIIGDIKPQNILVNDDGYVKVISSMSWPSQPMKIAHNWQKAQERLFLSPQQCEERTKKKDVSLDSNQSRYSAIYSIGLTILQAGTLKNCSEIYGAQNQYKFNQLKLIEFIDIFQNRYSPSFSQIIKEMLHIMPKKRWRPAYIYEILKPYEYQIMNLQQISIKLDRSSSVPRIERQQKISIKKIGQSCHNQSQNTQKSKVSNNSYKNLQYIKQINQNKHNRQSLMQSQNNNFWSHNNYHQNNPMLINHNYRHNYQSSPQQIPKFHLVNQYSNFGKPMPVQVIQPMQPTQPLPFVSNMKSHTDENRKMAISMPPDILAYQQQNRSRQHYITQQSMMPTMNRPLLQSRYVNGDIYYLNQ